MDTWFSSWLWPFSTMDEETRAKFYPTTDLVTGPDIIFFWVARMIMAGYRFQHDKPFSNVFFTSIIRDKIGRKMSKSLGNSPDPLDLIANYGADGLRFGLMRIAPTGTDVRFDENQISEGRNFANKLYNATRFRLMQGDARGETAPHYSSVHISIISKLKQLHADVEKALADYEFNALIQTLYQFFWNEYCDRFLEAVKGDLKDGADPAARQPRSPRWTRCSGTTWPFCIRSCLISRKNSGPPWALRKATAACRSCALLSPLPKTSWQDLMKAASPWRIPRPQPFMKRPTRPAT